MKTRLFLENNGYLTVEEVSISNFDCYYYNTAVYNWIANPSFHTITLPKIKVTRDVNYEAIYDFKKTINAGEHWDNRAIKIIKSEDEVIKKVEDNWKDKNFFSNPAGLYQLIQSYAEVNQIKEGGQHKTGVAAYNKLFNTSIKPRTQAELANIIRDKCLEKDVEASINLSIDDKLLILHHLKADRVPEAVFAHQITDTLKELDINNKTYLFPAITLAPINNGFDLCMQFKGNRAVVRVNKNLNYRGESNVIFTTGRCDDCANRGNGFASIEEIMLAIRQYDSTIVARTTTPTSVMITLSDTLAKNMINSMIICERGIAPSTKLPNRLAQPVCHINVAVTKTIGINPKPPFHIVEIKNDANDRNGINLARLLTNGHCDSLLGTFGIIAQCLKTLEAKKAAIVEKIVKAYEIAEQYINNFFVTNKLGRSSITRNNLALKVSANNLSFGSVCTKVVIQPELIANFETGYVPAIPVTSIPVSTRKYTEEVLEPTFKKLKEDKIIYQIDDATSRYIIGILMQELLFMYFDRRTHGNNFVKWDAPKATLHLDWESYLNNYILANSSTSRTVTLTFRND